MQNPPRSPLKRRMVPKQPVTSVFLIPTRAMLEKNDLSLRVLAES